MHAIPCACGRSQSMEKAEPPLTVSTLDELLSVATNGIPEGVTSFKISQDLSTLRVRVCGKGYGASIPGEQLRTLWELQTDLYRLAAFAIHGSTDIRVLTQEERHQFELKVTVEEGSWLSEIATADFWSAFFEHTVGKMSGAELGLTIGGCALLICGYLSWSRYNQRLEIVEKEKTQQKQTDSLVRVVESFTSKENTKANACLERTGDALTATAEKIAKRGHDISSLEVAGMSYDDQDIERMRARTRADSESADTISSLYQILAVDKGNVPWSIKLRDKFSGEELSVRFAKDAIDGDGEIAASDLLKAFSSDTPATFEITLGKKRNLINSVEVFYPDAKS